MPVKLIEVTLNKQIYQRMINVFKQNGEYKNPQEVQGAMLTTFTFSPLHCRCPASHSLMV